MVTDEKEAKKILDTFKKETDVIIEDLLKILLTAQKKVDNVAYRKALEQLKNLK